MSSSAVNVPTTAAEKPAVKLADFLNTAEEDAEIDGRRREENRQRKQHQKDLKKARKRLGDWKPYDPYKIRHPTKIGLYKVDDEMYPKLKMEFGDFLRKARGEEPRLASVYSSDESPEPSHSRSTSPKASNAMFAPPSSNDPAHTPPAPAVDLPQTVEEMLAKRAQLAGQRGVVPVASSRTPTPPPPVAEPLNTTPPARTPSPSPLPELEADPEPESEPLPELDPAKLAQKKRLDEVKAQIKAKAAALNARLAEKSASPAPPPLDQSAAAPPPPAPPSATPPPPPPPQAAYSATISAEPVHYARPSPPKAPYNPTISAEPVRYAQPVPLEAHKKPADDDLEDDRPAKKRKQAPADEPKKLSKAELMMAKMGWKKGEGLGKESDGIVSALNVKSGRNMGSDRIIGTVTGGQRKQETNQERFGEPSKVVVSWGCVDGVSFEDDAEREDGGVRQEMGDSFNKKFGEVERIHVDMAGVGRPVYIKFKDHMSALNAVNRFFEGYKFQDRVIRAEFYDEKKFNASIYEH
ncbi:hypothetical protein BDV96DRAFT_402989 [Lophiotrema nucula]|uniref:G-patch domain-containing protein n=1 Tax=Lophiotrema nucula TaxID=690887 RepID=A0A6A5ZEW1_9PLEO|nr:hypothetical protein BDV96DRAFT_402989 [Lophiotrema nucula]